MSLSDGYAHAAIQSFHKVVYREAHMFFEDIFEANQTGNKKRLYKTLSDADLLIIDDLFLRKKMSGDRLILYKSKGIFKSGLREGEKDSKMR